MRTRTAIWLMMTAMVLGGCAKFLPAQDQAEESKPAKAASGDSKAPMAARAVRPYHLDFVIKEVEGGKKINGRHYSTDLNAGESGTIKIGTRVPVTTSGKDGFPEQWQYMDVGTTIHCRLLERADDVIIDVHTDVSDFALPQASNPTAAGGVAPAGTTGSPAVATLTHPVVRQIELEGVTLLITDKPMMIASVDDPNSNREFQLEVTATRLK
jgi:hypothetical protein